MATSSSALSPKDRIITNARIRLPGVLDTVMKSEMFFVMKEFLTDTGAWKEYVAFTITSEVEAYDIYPNDAFDIHRLIGVKDSSENDVYSWFTYPGRINIRGACATGEALAEVVAIPKTTDNDDYPRCPEWLYTKYENTILDGILSRLLSQPAKPYSSEKLAIYHMRRFRNGMAIATSDARRNHVDRGQAWRFPQTFATIR
jgi:hypothetical protein